MSEQSCGNCRFWFEYPDDMESRGECHRHAPQPMLVLGFPSPFVVGEEENGVSSDAYPMWAVTAFSDWCGDWQSEAGLQHVRTRVRRNEGGEPTD